MSDLLHVLASRLTYEGNLLHSLINHGLIALTAAPFLAPAPRSEAQAVRGWIGCFLLALAVQVLLWFAVGAGGVSVVWCAMAGFGASVRTGRTGALGARGGRLLTIAIAGALVGILYYAATFPIITTVAHGVAVAMGAGTFHVFRARRARAVPEHAGR